MTTQRWHYTYSFGVICLQVDDVILWEGPPCFTEQISITIKTLGKDIKTKGTNVNQINVTYEMKNKLIKLESTTAFSSAGVKSSVFKQGLLYFSQVLVLYEICYHTIIWQPANVWIAVGSLCWKVTAFLLLDSFLSLPFLFLSFPFPLYLCVQWGEQWAG